MTKTLSLLNNQTPTRRRSAPSRVEPLATLPVFYKLQGKIAIIANGSDAAAWKAELLAASGAHVKIYAPELEDQFTHLLENPPKAGRFEWFQRPWARDCFHHAAIAICDAETDGEAQAFYCAARAEGVSVNVIDKPAFCEFQFGSIVNRSPAIISISTDGAAPILGQAIRRRIETLVPPKVGDWAKLAQSIRAEINDRLDFGAPRRRFWEWFVDKTFSGSEVNALSPDECIASADKLRHVAQRSCGKVTLVGAGPGDAELLTLKAVRALQAADVILFDDLVGPDILELARREAKRTLVGKRGGRESCKQDDINTMMVSLAKAGKNVVRLKGGDPMIFGRAGEEITRLKAENIDVSIVPGITSALAMAAELGVSLTHRDCAQSVRFVTGHSRQGDLPNDVNWRGIADQKTTTIFYMGGRTAAKIAQRLMGEGMDPTTTVVVNQSIGRDDKREWVGDLSNLPDGMNEIGFDRPVLIGVGHVFEHLKHAAQAKVATL